VTLTHADQIYRITLAQPELLSIRGVVIDAEGVPVLDTWVRASNSDRLLGIYADLISFLRRRRVTTRAIDLDRLRVR
jgi:hypothetical protein